MRAVIGADELREVWRIFTPLLDQIDNEAPQPVVHEFQTVVPDGVVELASAAGMTFNAMVRALLLWQTHCRAVSEERSVFAQANAQVAGAKL